MCSKMQKQMTISQDEAPEDLPVHVIMQDILPRLPVKFVIRGKSVSKFWHSVSSSPGFVKSYLKFSPSSHLQSSSSPPQFLIFLYHQYPPCRVVLLSFDECSRGKLVNMDFAYNGRDIYVVGSCNGLICLHDKVCLWNPATRCYNYISVPDYDKHEKIIVVGFGYVPSIDDYKIVCLQSSDYDAIITVYLYSLNAAKWDRKTSLDNDRIDIAQGEGTVVIDDTLYWSPVFRTPITNPVTGVNLVSGQLTKFPYFNTIDSTLFEKMKPYQMEGRLSCCCEFRYFPVVWMLKQDEFGWTRLYKVYVEDLDLLYSTENGKCLILKDPKLMLLDPRQIFLEQFGEGTSIDGHVANALEYKESLVSPFETTPAENED